MRSLAAPNGNKIERFKARLTAMGCFQKPGVDYGDIIATSRIKCYIGMCPPPLSTPLQEKVFMRQASGHEAKSKESWVYQLVKGKTVDQEKLYAIPLTCAEKEKPFS